MSSLYSHFFILSTPPSLCPSFRFVLQLCQHSVSHSISFSGSLISCLPPNFTWPDVVLREGQLLADAFHSPDIPSNQILLHKPLCFFYCLLFLLSSLPSWGPICFGGFVVSWSACIFPSSFFSPSNKRERGKTGPMNLFFSLRSSLFTPPPLLLTATLNSPLLIQLPRIRDSACSDCFTPYGPSHLKGTLTTKVGVKMSLYVSRCKISIFTECAYSLHIPINVCCCVCVCVCVSVCALCALSQSALHTLHTHRMLFFSDRL